MSTRPGCSASGADSGDKLRVRDLTGTAGWQTGSSNATLFDSHTQMGGDIIVEGTANRSDEIITYEVLYESGTCPFCLLLPVEWGEFDAFLEGQDLTLEWTTVSEINNRGFHVEVSKDGQYFDRVRFETGKWNHSTNKLL